ncbi:RNA polymerase sigma-70 factor [Phocaeicola sp.]
MKNTEKIIVEQLKQGHEQSYKYIYEHHYVFLCHIADSYVKDHYIAETIVGDVIFHLWEIRETLDITSSIRSYLTKAVRNRCINYLVAEREKNEVSLTGVGIDEAPMERVLLSDNYPLGTLLERELEEVLIRSFNKLSVECKAVFEKSRLEGKKNPEIALELGISVNTVKYHIKNALAILQADLSKYMVAFLLLMS